MNAASFLLFAASASKEAASSALAAAHADPLSGRALGADQLRDVLGKAAQMRPQSGSNETAFKLVLVNRDNAELSTPACRETRLM